MATAPQPTMPPLYSALQPLSSQAHAAFHLRTIDRAPQLARQHAIPLAAEEFPLAARFYPIVFASAEDGVPLALMGLNEGMNTFVDDQGVLIDQVYVPAYVRRYPFMLARLRDNVDELSLCFDPTSPFIGAFEDGEPLFTDGQPASATKTVLEFCENFETALQRTQLFIKDLVELDLLIDGELTIQHEENGPTATYRGFRMVSEEKLRQLRGDQLRKLAQSGALMLVYAHLMSLSISRDIFARQISQGKMAAPQRATSPTLEPAPFTF